MVLHFWPAQAISLRPRSSPLMSLFIKNSGQSQLVCTKTLWKILIYSVVTNVTRRAALRPQAGIQGSSLITCLLPEVDSQLESAHRSIHLSRPLLAPYKTPIPSSTTSATEPITALAQRDSNQYSLEHPQGKAGLC